MANSEMFTEAEGKHCRVHYDTLDLRVLYQGGANAGVRLDPEVVGSRPQTGGGGQRIQRRGRG